MIDFLKHAFGLCGEGHPSIFSLIIGGYAVFNYKYITYIIKEKIINLSTLLTRNNESIFKNKEQMV